MTLASLVNDWLPLLHVQNVGDLEFWTPEEVYRELDDAMLALCRSARVSVVDLSIAAGGTITLPARVLSVMHVAWNGKALRPAPVREIEALAGGAWRSTTGTPDRWVNEFDGVRVVRLYPAPSSGTVQVLAHVAPDSLEIGETLDMPLWVGDAIAAGAWGKLLARESDSAMPEVAARCRDHLKIYQQAAAGLYGTPL
jgi:hypothetical protein